MLAYSLSVCSVKLGNAVKTLGLEVILGRSPGQYYSSSQQIKSSFWFLFSKDTNVVGQSFSCYALFSIWIYKLWYMNMKE